MTEKQLAISESTRSHNYTLHILIQAGFKMNLRVFVVLLSVALPVFSGCGADGPETAEVSGVVTLGGSPLPEATIIFTPDKGGRSSTAVSDGKGAYTLMFKEDQPGAELGKHTVTVTTGGETYDADGNEIEREEKVPAKYNIDQAYKQEVKAGANEINLTLEAGPAGSAANSGGGEGEEEE